MYDLRVTTSLLVLNNESTIDLRQEEFLSRSYYLKFTRFRDVIDIIGMNSIYLIGLNPI